MKAIMFFGERSFLSSKFNWGFRLVYISRGKTFIIHVIHVIDFVRRSPGMLENWGLNFYGYFGGSPD
jgi:hypothetical protein